MLRWEEMRKKVDNGEIESVNRSKSDIIRMKVDKGGLTASSWFLKGKTHNVISCQPTPGGVLARKLSKTLNELCPNKRILVTEDGGLPVSASIRKTDPFKRNSCRFNDPLCIVEQHKDCAKMGVIYEISCVSCNQTMSEVPVSRSPGSWNMYNYVGMTRISVHWRMIGHLQGQKSRSDSNPLHRHDREIHNGVEQKYVTRILSSERNLLPLCVLEGLYIEKQVKQ